MTDATRTPGAQPRRTGNNRGAWALGLGITAVLLFWMPFLYLLTSVVGGILAIVLGVQGRRLAREGRATNRGMATTGMVLGIVGVSLGVLSFLLGALAGAARA